MAQQSTPFVAVVSLIALTLIIALGVSSVGAGKDKKPETSESDLAALTPLEQPTVTFVNPRRGAQNGKVQIVVFGDYGCSACKNLEAELSAAIARHPNDVTVVWKDLPNPSAHPGAGDAAVAARCAANQGAFWDYHDALFLQDQGLSIEVFAGLAGALGLDTAKFSQCLTNTETKPLVERDIEEAIRLRIDATPYLFIGSQRISGAVSGDSLEGFITQALKPSK